MITNLNCKFCGKDIVCQLGNIYLQRQDKYVDQYFCLTCNSAFHISNYVEDDGQLKADANWLSKNKSDFSELSKYILNNYKDNLIIVDVGCGVGTLLDYFPPDKYIRHGYDLNPYLDNYFLNSSIIFHNCLYTGQIVPDLILCSDVMEHLENPSELVKNLRKGMNKDNLLIIRSEMVWPSNYDEFKYVSDKNARSKLFRDNSVHISFPSEMGLLKLFDNYGFQPKFKNKFGGFYGFTIN